MCFFSRSGQAVWGWCQDVYRRQGHESRLLSRSTEDVATVTSVLVPWNTCGMTQSVRGIRAWLLALNQCCEIIQRDDINVRERRLPQHVVVAVVGDNVFGSGCNGTVHKLVVIRVCLYHFKVIVGRDEFHEGAVDDGLHNKFGRVVVRQPLQNLYILLQNLSGNTKYVLALDQRIPYWAVTALTWDALDKTIGVENNLHITRLFQLMKVHPVDFVQPFLVKRARFPQRIQAFFHSFGVVAIENILQLLKSTLALVECKHLKQMYL